MFIHFLTILNWNDLTFASFEENDYLIDLIKWMNFSCRHWFQVFGLFYVKNCILFLLYKQREREKMSSIDIYSSSLGRLCCAAENVYRDGRWGCFRRFSLLVDIVERFCDTERRECVFHTKLNRLLKLVRSLQHALLFRLWASERLSSMNGIGSLSVSKRCFIALSMVLLKYDGRLLK